MPVMGHQLYRRAISSIRVLGNSIMSPLARHLTPGICSPLSAHSLTYARVLGQRDISDQGGSLDQVKEKTWEVCALYNSIKGPRSGFFCFLSISSAALNVVMQHAGPYGNFASTVWRPDATHAIAVTDANIGTKGTLDMLAFILERKQIPGYFTRADTRVYYLYCGLYNRLNIPWCLRLDQVKYRSSSAASKAFMARLKYQQPLEILIASPKKIYVLRWYFSQNGMVGFHGMWVGELQNSRVVCVKNDIKTSPYASWYKFVLETVKSLPPEILEEMCRTWTSKPPNQSLEDFATSQFLKHAVQGKDILVDKYWEKATTLSWVFTHEKLEEIREMMNYEWGKFYECEELRQVISKVVGKQVQVGFIPDDEYGVLANSVTAITDSEFRPIDHPDTICRYVRFRFKDALKL